MAEISGRIVITPNVSMTRKQLYCFLLGMCGICLGIAIGFAMLGLWLVLPFAGIEMLVLVLAFLSVRRTVERREVISVDEERIVVEAGRLEPEQSCVLQRCWTRVLLELPKISGYPSRLLLRCGSRQVEIGACLSNEERECLRQRLDALTGLPRSFAAVSE